MKKSLNVAIDVTTDGNTATIAEAQMWSADVLDFLKSAKVRGDEFTRVKCSSIRHPTDKFDSEVAYNLAVGRALEALGLRLQKRAAGKMKHNEKVREFKKTHVKKTKAEITKILSEINNKKKIAKDLTQANFEKALKKKAPKKSTKK